MATSSTAARTSPAPGQLLVQAIDSPHPRHGSEAIAVARPLRTTANGSSQVPNTEGGGAAPHSVSRRAPNGGAQHSVDNSDDGGNSADEEEKKTPGTERTTAAKIIELHGLLNAHRQWKMCSKVTRVTMMILTVLFGLPACLIRCDVGDDGRCGVCGTLYIVNAVLGIVGVMFIIFSLLFEHSDGKQNEKWHDTKRALRRLEEKKLREIEDEQSRIRHDH